MTPEINALMLRVEELGNAQDALNKQQREAANDLAKLVAVHQVGDEVVMNGYPHHGKKVRITKVSGQVEYTKITARVRYDAVLIKKDGSDSSVAVDFYSYIGGRTGRHS